MKLWNFETWNFETLIGFDIGGRKKKEVYIKIRYYLHFNWLSKFDSCIVYSLMSIVFCLKNRD